MKVCIYYYLTISKTTGPFFRCTCGCLRNSPHFPTCDRTQLIPAEYHQTKAPQRSYSRFNTFGYYLIAAKFNQRRWRKSAGFNQPLPAALPGSLQQQQVRLINLAQTAPSARSSSLASPPLHRLMKRRGHGTESQTWFTTKLAVQVRLTSG